MWDVHRLSVGLLYITAAPSGGGAELPGEKAERGWLNCLHLQWRTHETARSTLTGPHCETRSCEPARHSGKVRNQGRRWPPGRPSVYSKAAHHVTDGRREGCVLPWLSPRHFLISHRSNYSLIKRNSDGFDSLKSCMSTKMHKNPKYIKYTHIS